MKLTKRTRTAFLAGAAATVAAAVSISLQTGVVHAKPPEMVVPFEMDVPDGATHYTYVCYDHDGWWDPDDPLFVSVEHPVPVDDKGQPVKKINIQVHLFCSGGHVAGQGGPSGEATAEPYVQVTWNNGHGMTESPIAEVSCPDS